MDELLWTLKGDVSRRASGAQVVCPCVRNGAEQAETAAGAETDTKPDLYFTISREEMTF